MPHLASHSWVVESYDLVRVSTELLPDGWTDGHGENPEVGTSN